MPMALGSENTKWLLGLAAKEPLMPLTLEEFCSIHLVRVGPSTVFAPSMAALNMYTAS